MTSQGDMAGREGDRESESHACLPPSPSPPAQRSCKNCVVSLIRSLIQGLNTACWSKIRPSDRRGTQALPCRRSDGLQPTPAHPRPSTARGLAWLRERAGHRRGPAPSLSHTGAACASIRRHGPRRHPAREQCQPERSCSTCACWSLCCRTRASSCKALSARRATGEGRRPLRWPRLPRRQPRPGRHEHGLFLGLRQWSPRRARPAARRLQPWVEASRPRRILRPHATGATGGGGVGWSGRNGSD